MRHAKLLIATSVALLCANLACAAADNAAADTPAADHGMGKMHHMMGKDGDHGAKGHRCMHHGPMMGEGHMPPMGHMLPLPSLPPGNEKLQLQMQAEMMQKVGEILAR